ncbi:MAG TPA: DASS family sodium-coupled anion symporter [Bryobacteraceae bacterium]|nr:DASS family sodium-coupled anion symporter [Bryobacteraceae bacterium]
MSKARGLAALVVIYLAVAHLIPRPGAVTPEGWRLFGIFVATVAGLVIEPLPGGAIVLLAVLAATLLAGLTLARALSGYADATVWLVLAAFFISRALINTGLARRIALIFVRLFGRNSVGICYALGLSDMVLASVIPSSAARSGGVILPIARSIAELYGSKPDSTARLLGSFLMTGVYQAVCISCAMFYTGQASNPLAAQMAANTGYTVTWASWFAAGIVPGLCSMAIVPWVVLRVNPPEIRHTPEASEFARRELRSMGPMSRAERILAFVFASVCGLWVTSNLHGIDITITALLGAVALLLTGVLDWEDVKSERSAWDIFIWYGGLVMLGKALSDARVTTEFARMIGGGFAGLAWPMLFATALLIYFYAHYAFASITTHLLAMYPPFLAILLARGAPPGLMIFAFACFANLAAGLTHYGTTPGPMFFAHEYVPLRRWWLVGLAVSVVNIAIWSTIGFGWWKLIRVW